MMINDNKELFSASNNEKRSPDEFRVFEKHFIGMGLEIGCGKNRISPDVLAIDRSDQSEADLVCNGDDLPFADRTFDFLVSVNCLKDHPKPIDMLQEWIRVVKSGGRIIVILPNMDGVELNPKTAAWTSTPAILVGWTSQLQLEFIDGWNLDPESNGLISQGFGVVWHRLPSTRDQILRTYTPCGLALVVNEMSDKVEVVYQDMTRKTWKKSEVTYDGYSRQTKDYHLLA